MVFRIWFVLPHLYANDEINLRRRSDYHIFKQLEQLSVAFDRIAITRKYDCASSYLESRLRLCP